MSMQRLSANYHSILQSEHPSTAIRIIKEDIIKEEINLQIHEAFSNESECIAIEHRIIDAKMCLLFISGDLP